MRAGSNCSVYQALTSEALGVLKLSITLARRRDHAQVTPLHVANTMLASSSGHLRKACLQSNSHPLQCKALELCFNVALNRLPISSPTSTSTLTPRHNHPTISNALVAAFKRAQAHQRRGSIESQHQPILAVRIELEQLVISILDDPSVSRVMKEAGFSSPQVKSNVEKLSHGVHNKVGKPKSSSQAINEDLTLLISMNREPKDMKRSERDQCINDVDEHQLTCCSVCSSKFEAEARSLKNSNAATLPTWLQLYKEENQLQKLNKDPMEMDIFSNPNSTVSNDYAVKDAHEYIKCFIELNWRNIEILSNALEEKVPWRKDIVPCIVNTILQCRSGIMCRKGSVAKGDEDGNGDNISEIKEETWLLFQGIDLNTKETIARELARLIFGSQTSLVTISVRDEPSISYLERFADEIATNPHRVFLIKDMEQANYCSQMGIKMAIESGRIKYSIEKESSLRDAIIILSCGTSSSRSRACSPATKMGDGLEEEEISHCLSLDLNTSCNYDHDRSIDYIELSDFVDKWIVFKS